MDRYLRVDRDGQMITFLVSAGDDVSSGSRADYEHNFFEFG